MFGSMNVQQSQLQQQQQQQLQLQQQMATNPTNQFAENFAKMAMAFTRPAIHGDERDTIIAKLSQLLAFSGCGKGIYHRDMPPVEFGPENPFCRFKAVGYNRLGGHKNEDGLVAFIVKRSATELSNNRQTFIDGVGKVMGSKPNLSLNIESIRPLPNDTDNKERCEVVAYVTEKSQINDAVRRIPAMESHNFFSQPANKPQMEQLLQVVGFGPKVDPSLNNLEDYRMVPREGIDWTVWMQAQRDNPDPAKLIPWPILGFGQLRERQVMQQQEVTRQGSDLKNLVQKIDQIEQKTLTSQSRLAQLKTSEDQLSHRVLKLMANILRRSREGHALDANEELLQSRLEGVFLRLNGPLQIKGRLSELLSQLRTRNYTVSDQMMDAAGDSALSTKFVDETKTHLKKYQDGLEKLVEIAQNDLKDLDVVEDTLKNNRDRYAPRK